MAETTYADNYALGEAGEAFAAAHYEDRGYRLLARRVRLKSGEIDLIARATDGTVVFVEVKSRRSRRFGAAEAVTAKKLRTMRRCAAEWLEATTYVPVRFDVAEVLASSEGMHIRVYEDVDDGAC